MNVYKFEMKLRDCNQITSASAPSTKMIASKPRLVVPYGLKTLLEGVSRAILKTNPGNITQFAALYFKELILFREANSSLDIKDLVKQFHQIKVEKWSEGTAQKKAECAKEQETKTLFCDEPRQKEKSTDTEEDNMTGPLFSNKTTQFPSVHTELTEAEEITESVSEPSPKASTPKVSTPPSSPSPLAAASPEFAYVPADPAQLAAQMLGNVSSVHSEVLMVDVATSMHSLPNMYVSLEAVEDPGSSARLSDITPQLLSQTSIRVELGSKETKAETSSASSVPLQGEQDLPAHDQAPDVPFQADNEIRSSIQYISPELNEPETEGAAFVEQISEHIIIPFDEPSEGQIQIDRKTTSMVSAKSIGSNQEGTSAGSLRSEASAKSLSTKSVHTAGGSIKSVHTAAGSIKSLEIEGSLKSLHTEGSTKSLRTAEGSLKSVHTEGSVKSVHTADGSVKSLHVEGSVKSVHTEGSAKSVHTEGSKKSVHTEGSVKSVHAEGSAKSVRAEGSAKSIHSASPEEITNVSSGGTPKSVHSAASAPKGEKDAPEGEVEGEAAPEEGLVPQAIAASEAGQPPPYSNMWTLYCLTDMNQQSRPSPPPAPGPFSQATLYLSNAKDPQFLQHPPKVTSPTYVMMDDSKRTGAPPFILVGSNVQETQEWKPLPGHAVISQPDPSKRYTAVQVPIAVPTEQQKFQKHTPAPQNGSSPPNGQDPARPQSPVFLSVAIPIEEAAKKGSGSGDKRAPFAGSYGIAGEITVTTAHLRRTDT
ncbi:calcium-binding tyrosine phosphorylation-regulated protein isoform X1 [Sarcophilus harrisii]|uniref:calcium-binding tyrosine phosphorylation-regulated protein isoform X1 n=2 Tax=Sarcophilus harrisii TaxID=9305 RepID=UPI00062B5110|nr:calcium-binding tyrosine phosphorylation-regulated protein isoform X1 [Sarcophilus harrisii]